MQGPPVRGVFQAWSQRHFELLHHRDADSERQMGAQGRTIKNCIFHILRENENLCVDTHERMCKQTFKFCGWEVGKKEKAGGAGATLIFKKFSKRKL